MGESLNKHINFKQLKICFIVGSLGRGGAERQFIYILNTLREEGASIHIISLTSNEFWEVTAKKSADQYYTLGHTRSRIIRLVKIAKIVFRIKPTILYSTHFFTNTYAGLAGKITKTESIGSIRSNARDEIRTNGFWSKLHISLPDRLVVNSKNALDNLKSKKITKTYLLKNVINTKSFAYKERAQRSKKLLFVGRLEPVKQPEMFIKLIQELTKKSIPITGTIVGSGSLKQSIDKLNIKQCELVGEKGDVKPYYYTADLLVITSKYEGTPNVVLEAMATGLPVIALRFDGIENTIIDGTTGFIAENITDMVDKTITILNNQSLSVTAANARKYIEENHSIDSLKESLQKLFFKK